MKLLSYLILFILFASNVLLAGIDPSNKFKLGDGANTSKTIEANVGLGSANPKLKYDASSAKWQFANDGSMFRDFGSGSGGGGAGYNLLTTDDNPGFEDGTTGWTASGGSFTTTTSSPLYGTTSGVFDASASSQKLSSAAKTPVTGLQDGGNCLIGISYKYSGSDGDYSLQAFDGTNVLNEITLDQATLARDAFLGFQCPTSGTVLARIISNVSNPGAITLDGPSLTGGSVQLGSNILLAQVNSGAQLAGSAYIAGTGSCTWTRASATLGSFGTVAACPGPTIEQSSNGTWQTTDTDLPKFTVNNLPAGTYLAIAHAALSHSAGAVQVQLAINDGTTTSGAINTAPSGATATERVEVTVTGVFTYSSTGNRTFELFGAAGSGTLDINNDNTNAAVYFKLIRFPTSSSTALVGIDTQGWYVDANISGANIPMVAAAYQETANAGLTMTTNTGSIGTQIPCSGTNPSTGLTCAAGNESVGVVYNQPRPGTVIACVSFSAGATSDGGTLEAAYKIVETPNNAQTILQEAHTQAMIWHDRRATSSINGTISHSRVCGPLTFTSTGQKTLRLFSTSNTTIINIFADGSTSNGEGSRDIHWEVYPISQQMPMPLLVKQLQSTSTAIMKNATAYISNSGTPTITRQDGSWISSLTDNGAGDTTVNISASTFSTTPNCTCSGVEESADTTAITCSPSKATALSNSAYRIKTRSAGTLTDRDFVITCTGPK